jgi:hypothetical protein
MPSREIQVAVSPGGKTAQAKFRARVTTQGEGSGGSLDIEMSLQLAKEPVRYFWLFPGEEWKVISADGYSGLEGL